MKQNITARFSTPADAPAFAQWALDNPDIPSEDIDAVANGAPMTLVIEVDGKPELYMPLIPAVTIGYLGFRPDQDARTKAIALQAMRAELQRFLNTLKISDAYVFTKAEYPMGKWALKNGFKPKAKDAFTLEKD